MKDENSVMQDSKCDFFGFLNSFFFLFSLLVSGTLVSLCVLCIATE